MAGIEESQNVSKHSRILSACKALHCNCRIHDDIRVEWRLRWHVRSLSTLAIDTCWMSFRLDRTQKSSICVSHMACFEADRIIAVLGIMDRTCRISQQIWSSMYICKQIAYLRLQLPHAHPSWRVSFLLLFCVSPPQTCHKSISDTAAAGQVSVQVGMSVKASALPPDDEEALLLRK